ncbi:MAG: magnesium chelatase subunit D [Burkholderiales bacterium]|nr:magnesium chelatase subunit D [Burkholderiales bacterium]
MLAPLDREPDPSGRAWELAVRVAVLFAIDPAGLGGVRVRAHAGPVRDAWLAMLKAFMGERAWVRVPQSVTDERLLGGLDLPATLSAGRPISQSGLLATVDGGVLVLSMAERISRATAARITQAMDNAQVVVERDGIRQQSSTQFGVVALDEATPEDDGLPEALCDRMAFDIDLRAISPRFIDTDMASAEEITAARERLEKIEMPEAMIDALCSVAMALGVSSLRSCSLALSAARASAAFDDNECCNDDDAQIAASLVLAPRATQLPHEDDDTEGDDAQPEPQQSPAENDSPSPLSQQQAMEDRVLDAAQAAIPPNLLAALISGIKPVRMSGKSGAYSDAGAHGRPIGSRRANNLRGRRLHLVDTLRAAAPWQRLRRALSGEAVAKARVLVRAEDFHVTRVRQRSASVTVFVVDASGSSAMHRLSEVKGAIEMLLAECYVRRDQVALVAFRGRSAELLLPPTRSLTAARRRLSGLPGGGGTPLASALEVTASLVDSLARRGQSPLVVLLTDGRANVALDGSGGRERAQQEAMQTAQQLAQVQVPVLLIDTSPKPQQEAATLARAMRARYLPLPHAGSAQLAQTVRLATGTEPRAFG